MQVCHRDLEISSNGAAPSLPPERGRPFNDKRMMPNPHSIKSGSAEPHFTNVTVDRLVPPPTRLCHPTPLIQNRRWSIVLAFVLGLLMVACGPESAGTDHDRLVAETHQLALDYQSSSNLEQAQARLSALAVPNHNQWLIYITETAIEQSADANLLAALVKLTTDLGLESTPITAYGVAHNLLAPPPSEPVVEEPVVAAPLAQEAAPVEPAPVVEAPAPITTTERITTENATGEGASDETTTTGETAGETTGEVTTTSAPPMAQASDMLNVRGGPGTQYNLVGSLQKDELVEIVGKNPAGDWWQVRLAGGQQGWVLGQFVQTTGETAAVTVATDIPAPPPTPAPAPVAAAPANPPAEAPAAAPPAQEEAPAEAPAEEPAQEQAEEAAPPPADPNAAPHFTLVSKRLWNKDENDGCVGKHLLRIHVLDAGGNRLNGIRLKGVYTGDELVTGDQGKGDGIIEFDLHGSGEGFTVIRNNDGREATSDRAEGFTTRSIDIDQQTLINTGYCSNDADCRIFYDSWGCHGHHSWEATFQRNY
jgi:uncharacterized protein YraI